MKILGGRPIARSGPGYQAKRIVGGLRNMRTLTQLVALRALESLREGSAHEKCKYIEADQELVASIDPVMTFRI